MHTALSMSNGHNSSSFSKSPSESINGDILKNVYIYVPFCFRKYPTTFTKQLTVKQQIATFTINIFPAS